MVLLVCVKNKKGLVTLLSILIIGALGAALAVSLLGIGISFAKTSYSLERAGKTKALADACAEEALYQIKNSNVFTGNGTLFIEQGSCYYEILNSGGQNRQINVSATISSSVRNIEINIDQINPQIHILSWQELSDF